MITFANAKINLGLQIVGKRADGYHLLQSLFVPIPLCDVLEISPRLDGGEDRLSVLGGIDVGAEADNLVLRAVRAVRAEYQVPSLDITLRKQIPSGAGMGGGSADASFTLKAVRELFDLTLSDEDLERIALSLGADCPFFIKNKPMLVEGIGEIFRSTTLPDLSAYHLVVVKPNIHISTAEAFRGLKRIGGHSESVEELLKLPIEMWRGRLKNDFEDSLFPLYPELSKLKTLLYDLGAIYASMTGSGAALYGFFPHRLGIEEQARLGNCFFWQGG